MNKKRRLTNKYILLAILLIAVFVLPSCRTRISNNSEITTVQYDESGFMSDEYQMRRDELGLSTAEKPLLPNFGSGESDDSEDFEEGESIDYNPEDYQEDFTEPETNTNNNNNNRNNSNTGTRNRSTTPSRRTPGTSTTTRYTVTFDANGGKVNGSDTYKIKVKKGHKIGELPTAKKGSTTTKTWYTSKTGTSTVKSTDTVNSSITLYAHWDNEKKEEDNKVQVTLNGNNGTVDGKASKTIDVKKDSTVGSLPTASRKDYNFKGWATSKSGKPLKNSTKITAKATYYAQWEKVNKPVTITFDPGEGKSDKESIDVEEGSSYGPLPKATYKGHHFTGWYKDDGEKVEPSTKVSKAHTLHAEWEDWNVLFEEGLPDASSAKCFIVGGDGTGFVEECMGAIITESTAIDEDTYIIVFDDNPTKAKATGAKNEYGGKKAIVLSNDALSSEGYDQLLYKIVLVEKIYGELKYSYQDAEDDIGKDAKFAES